MVDMQTLQARAAEVLDPMAFDYFCGGADEESTLRDNVAAWDRLRLRPHVLRDVSGVSTATTVLGTPVTAPVLIAPTAYHELAAPVGESGTARAAAGFGTVMVLSTFSTQTMETVAEAAPDASLWFQLYVHRDRGFTADLLSRAAAAGYRAVVLTVDVPVLGRRRLDEGHRFGLPEPLLLAHSPEATQRPVQEGSALAAHVTSQADAALTFDDIGWVAQVSGLPVVVKGVLRGDDAADCVRAGAAAVVVSNHGGRQLDGAVATADALPEVVDALATVDADVEVYVDGGVRQGVDVVRALALGARAVLLGRPVVLALAVGGEDGVREVLDEITSELGRALALCGAPDVHRVERSLVVPATEGGNRT